MIPSRAFGFARDDNFHSLSGSGSSRIIHKLSPSSKVFCMAATPNPTFARAKVWLGVQFLLALAYWIAALNLHLPGEPWLAKAFEFGYTRRGGPILFWLLGPGGLLLIWTGLKDLGIAEEGL